MSYQLKAVPRFEQEIFNDSNTDDLMEQVIFLNEWKRKAIVQLEHFQYACKVYKLCDVDKVNELLNA